ncbi:Ubiquitin-conjugating enzyme E2 Z [Madurella fahalii]|uniref:Ubiquitin-conjugating enzyme E2 Z n=1 Tax=Madurella fahalii TaxID=1157608 RepID=A0ABQ0GAD2_9PEZI
MFLIFSLLCGFEPTVSKTGDKSRRLSKSETPAGAATSTQAVPAKQSQLAKGTGYGDSCTSPRNTALSVLLPSTRKPAPMPFDTKSHPMLSAMIARSPMLRHAAQLLRHATIEEIDTHCGPASAVLDFLRAIADHEDTTSIVRREQTLFPCAAQLPQILSSVVPNHGTPGAAIYETGQSLHAIIEQLATPCRKFVAASGRVANMEGEINQESLAVMKQICRMADSLTATHPPEPEAREAKESDQQPALAGDSTDKGKEQAETSLQAIAKDASEWHRANCVKDVPDEKILAGYHFKDAILFDAGSHARSRIKKILTQVTSLSADLPEGVFVRYGEGRPDLLKILIVGPDDTPYEHGLFEFDMFCDKDFPKTPPLMHFRTTGGGVAHFNPNLYANGTICLSLLGTWKGHPWEPDRSSILQILVSIQAMIFNSQPYYNEPGYERNTNQTGAETYNKKVELLTIPHAMTYWMTHRLKNPRASAPSSSGVAGPIPANSKAPHAEYRYDDDAIWGDVIRKHFELKGRMMLDTAKKWEAKQPDAPGMKNLVRDLQYRLREYGFLSE